MKKDKLLRRLSAMQFAMWEMREFLDTHPNCPDAKAPTLTRTNKTQQKNGRSPAERQRIVRLVIRNFCTAQ